MGFFDRLYDFGDREMVRTIALRVGVGLQQLLSETDTFQLRGLSSAVKQEVDHMIAWASKLTMESLGCLDVKFAGGKLSYFVFLSKIKEVSDIVVRRGGHPII